jgi:hypothetical protein
MSTDKIIRPEQFTRKKSAFAAARESSPPIIVTARLSGILAAVAENPKLMPGDAKQFASNTDTILRSLKSRISLGQLCQQLNLGDGKDPKALYNYRAPPEEGAGRKYVKDARKYLRLVEAIASAAGTSLPSLQRELIRGSSFDKTDHSASDAAVDCLELINGMGEWLMRTTEVQRAFELRKKYHVRTWLGYLKHDQQEHVFASVNDPFNNDECGATWLPRIALSRKRSAYKVDGIDFGADSVTAETFLQGTNGPAKVWLTETVYLSLFQSRSNKIEPFFETISAVAVNDELVIDFTVTRDGFLLTSKGGTKCIVSIPALTEQWDALDKEDGDPSYYWNYEWHQFDNDIAYIVHDQPLERTEVDVSGLRALDRLEGATTTGTFLSGWDQHSVSYGSSTLSALFHALTGNTDKSHAEGRSRTPARFLPSIAKGHKPQGGWAVTEPTEAFCSLPDLMWLLADEFSQKISFAVAWEQARERTAYSKLIEKFSGDETR